MDSWSQRDVQPASHFVRSLEGAKRTFVRSVRRSAAGPWGERFGLIPKREGGGVRVHAKRNVASPPLTDEGSAGEPTVAPGEEQRFTRCDEGGWERLPEQARSEVAKRRGGLSTAERDKRSPERIRTVGVSVSD